MLQQSIKVDSPLGSWALSFIWKPAIFLIILRFASTKLYSSSTCFAYMICTTAFLRRLQSVAVYPSIAYLLQISLSPTEFYPSLHQWWLHLAFDVHPTRPLHRYKPALCLQPQSISWAPGRLRYILRYLKGSSHHGNLHKPPAITFTHIHQPSTRFVTISSFFFGFSSPSRIPTGDLKIAPNLNYSHQSFFLSRVLALYLDECLRSDYMGCRQGPTNQKL